MKPESLLVFYLEFLKTFQNSMDVPVSVGKKCYSLVPNRRGVGINGKGG